MDAVARCQTLAGIPLFERLPAESLERVASSMALREFRAGDPLLRQGDPGDCVLVVVDGGVSVRLRRSDDVVVLATVGPGAVLGEMSLVTGAPRNADAVATSGGRALVLDAAAFHALAAETPELVLLLTTLVAERLGRAAHDGLGDKVLEGFRVVRPVGRGGMAVVYEAERLADGARVALKMMSHLFARNAVALDRFDREADILSRFRHDGITRFHGRFSAYGTVFLVIDFVDGTSLAEVLERGGPLPVAEARAAFGAIVAALAHVHRHGIAHGDLKPANVLVDRTGRLRLTDFGIARAMPGTERDAARPSDELVLISGTPRYMAPEQFVGGPAGTATDAYALGCVLAEMLTGRPPFETASLGALLFAKRAFDCEQYAATCGIADAEMRGVVAALLAPEPATRVLDMDRWAREAGSLPPERVSTDGPAAVPAPFAGDETTTLGT